MTQQMVIELTEHGQTLAQIEADIAAIETEYRAIATADPSAGNIGIGDFMATIMPRLQALRGDATMLTKRQQAVNDYIAALQRREAARGLLFKTQALQTRARALQEDLKQQEAHLGGLTTFNAVAYERVCERLGISQAIINQINLAIRTDER